MWTGSPPECRYPAQTDRPPNYGAYSTKRARTTNETP